MKKNIDYKGLIVIFIFIFITTALLFYGKYNSILYSSINQPPEVLDTGWYYKISINEASNTANDTLHSAGWKIYNKSEIINIKPTKNLNVWFKVMLPKGYWENPAILFKGILTDTVDIYSENGLIYSFNSNSKLYRNNYVNGIIIPIKKDYQGNFLYLRLHSESNTRLNIQDYVTIGAQRDLVRDFLDRDFGKLVFSHFFLIIFLCLFISAVFLRKLEKKALYNLCAFTLLIGLFTLGRCIYTIDLIYFYNPLFWDSVFAVSAYIVPIPFLLYFSDIFSNNNKKLFKALVIIHILLAIPLAPLAILNNIQLNMTVITLNNILELTFSLFGLFDFLLISFLSIKASIKGNIEARIYIVGLGICILSLVYEIINHKGALHWGFFAFILCQVLILARRYYLRLEHYASELKEKNEALSAMNKNLEQLVAVRTASINNLLNNAGQGFLAFDKELKVFKEYSSECIVIFKDSIEGKNIAGLIAQEDKHQLEFLENVFTSIFNEKDADRKLLYLGLLPSEKLINGNNIRLEYKLTHDQNNDKETIMLILTDITEERYYEHKAENERNILKMVIKIVLNLHEFTECIREYQSFCSYGISEAINTSPTVKSIVSEFYRSIHTFKGNLSIFNMMNSVKKLHDIEEKIVGLSRSSKGLTKADITQFISTLDLHKLLDEDMCIIEEVLGKKFAIQENNITIPRYKLFEIEQLISEKLDEELCIELLPTIRKLRYKPFSELLKTYPDYAIKLSDRLQKPIYPFVIKGGEMQVDTDRYSDFARTLVHIFRNALDHGIEPMELRVGKGKTEYGNIECLIWFENGHIVISITDDGQGIDLSKVRYKALEKGIYSDEELQSISDMELLNVIFEDEFSTKDTVNELSGRGVGLAAAKSEIERLNGRIEVYTEYDKGTEFRFIVPYYEETDFI